MQQPLNCSPIDWSEIDTLFLDMDGTLLDLRYDNYFWLTYLPEQFGLRRGLSLAEAQAELLPRYQRVVGQLDWYSVEYWSRQLELDVALLKREVAHLIQIHPFVIPFLEMMRAMAKRLVLVTNAHIRSIEIKMEKTRLHGYLDRTITSHDLGYPKEQLPFWSALQAVEPFDPQRTLFIDDSKTVLAAAHAYGISHLIAIAKPDSERPLIDHHGEPWRVVEDFCAITPSLAAEYPSF